MNKRGLIAIITAIVSAIVIIFVVIGLWGCSTNGSSEPKSTSSSSKDISLPKIIKKKPVNIAGVYQFKDFDEGLCWATCKIEIEVSEDGSHIAVEMGDNYSMYPVWYGSVDGQAIADKGEWASKRTADEQELRLLDESILGLNDKYQKFYYEDGNVVFDYILPAGKTVHVVAEPMA